MSVVARIIDSYGGAAALARRMDISRNAIWQWRKKDRVPAERVLDLEKLTGVSRHEIRPDIYPVPERAAAQRPAPEIGISTSEVA